MDIVRLEHAHASLRALAQTFIGNEARYILEVVLHSAPELRGRYNQRYMINEHSVARTTGLSEKRVRKALGALAHIGILTSLLIIDRVSVQLSLRALPCTDTSVRASISASLHTTLVRTGAGDKLIRRWVLDMSKSMHVIRTLFVRMSALQRTSLAAVEARTFACACAVPDPMFMADDDETIVCLMCNERAPLDKRQTASHSVDLWNNPVFLHMHVATDPSCWPSECTVTHNEAVQMPTRLRRKCNAETSTLWKHHGWRSFAYAELCSSESTGDSFSDCFSSSDED